jgi:V/A-type H+-transporting ATPase subunit C
VYEEHGNDLFLLDATIDRSFFIDLKHHARFLHDQDADNIRHVLGSLLDRFNLLWLLRYRFAYELSPAKSFYLLTTTGNRLHSTELMRLARMDSVEEVIAALPAPYQQLLDRVGNIADMEMVRWPRERCIGDPICCRALLPISCCAKPRSVFCRP